MRVQTNNAMLWFRCLDPMVESFRWERIPFRNGAVEAPYSHLHNPLTDRDRLNEQIRRDGTSGFISKAGPPTQEPSSQEAFTK
jgi:hypothetical protein